MVANFPDTFRAYEFTSFGDPFQEIKLNSNTQQPPLEPTEVRIRVHSTSLNIVDFVFVAIPQIAQTYVNKTPSSEHPMRLGFDVSGVVVEVGSAVASSETPFAVGDEIFASADFDCLGTFAEYVNLDVKYVAHKPKDMSFNAAAGLSLVGLTIHQAIVDYGRIQAGDRVLLLGGSSGTGAIGIQLAKALSASHITATCSSRNAELVKSFGADEVIDYTTADWKSVVEPHSIDLLVDCGMEPDSWNSGAQRVIKKDSGRFVTIGIPKEAPVAAEFGARHSAMIAKGSAESLRELSKLANAGKITVPIDSVHPFEALVPALKIVVSKHARGKVVVEVVASESEASK